MDTRFSTAIHILIMIAGDPNPIASEKIAESVGTNASYIRKITSLLRKNGIISSHQGVEGFKLLVKPEELSLSRVYSALYDTEKVHLFDLHQNPSDKCIVGRHIRPVLSDVFKEVERRAEDEMRETTLFDCMNKMRVLIDKE